MSPVDPRTLRPAERNRPIAPGTLCANCHYPLTGLPRGSRCPECGRPARVADTPSARDNLTDAPASYLRRLRWSITALSLLGIVNGLLQGVGYFIRPEVLPVLMVLAGAGWATAVYLVTGPRPPIPGSRTSPQREMLRLRTAARLTQWAWPLQGACYIAMLAAEAAGSPAADGFRVAARLAQLVGMVGFAPLCIWLAHLADWAQASTLAGMLRSSALLVGIGGAVFSACAWFALALPTSVITPPITLIALLTLFGYELGLCLLVVALFQLAHMANWAVVNAKAATERDLRVLERRARRTYAGQAAEGSILAELGAARGERALDPCAGCGYDLTGLPPGAPCPECGRHQEGGDTTFLRRSRRPEVELDEIPLAGDEPD